MLVWKVLDKLLQIKIKITFFFRFLKYVCRKKCVFVFCGMLLNVYLYMQMLDFVNRLVNCKYKVVIEDIFIFFVKVSIVVWVINEMYIVDLQEQFLRLEMIIFQLKQIRELFLLVVKVFVFLNRKYYLFFMKVCYWLEKIIFVF